MATGIDIAGLVLAVLPLVVEAAKAYSDGVESILDVALQSRYDEELQDFYDDFYMEMVRLGELTKQVRNAISGTLADGVNVPESTKMLGEWQSDSQLEHALRIFFGGDSDFEVFTLCSQRVLELLESFVQDKSSRMAATEQNDRKMFSKLRGLAEARKRGVTTSSLLERFRFSRNSKKRSLYLSKLRKWTDSFEKLMERVARRAGTPSEVIQDWRKSDRFHANSPPSQARRLVANLHRVLCGNENCGCASNHQIKIRLGKLEDAISKSDVNIDCFVSHTDVWQEANITLTATSTARQPSQTNLERMCSAFQQQVQDFSLGLLVQDINGQQTLWQLRPRPRRLRFQESLSPISLQDLLASSPVKLNLAEKRRLALTIAYSLLLYHESPWLSNGWLKKDLFFFYKNEDEPDLEHPFLSAGFESQSKNVQGPGDVFHRSPQILALAILLIEIHNEKPIESWRKKRDMAHITVNTDMIVAERVLDKMDDGPFQQAIRACLSMEWVPESKIATLDDDDIRLGFMFNVIAPLEQEVEWERNILPTRTSR